MLYLIHHRVTIISSLLIVVITAILSCCCCFYALVDMNLDLMITGVLLITISFVLRSIFEVLKLIYYVFNISERINRRQLENSKI